MIGWIIFAVCAAAVAGFAWMSWAEYQSYLHQGRSRWGGR